MNKLLVVEDEVNTSDLLRRYFEIMGYEVVTAHNGEVALKMAEQYQPVVIILDIMLPDIDGYDVCRKLRSNTKTDRIPIVFLTQKDERRDRLEGLGLGADDYVTKPFDVEELRLRVHNIIARLSGTTLVDPRTSLPNTELMKLRLPALLKDPDAVFMDAQIAHYDAFEKKYGPVAANQILRGAAKVIGDVLHETTPGRSFIAHPRNDHFLFATTKQAAERVEHELPARFRKQALRHYDYEDQSQGKMKLGENNVPLVALKLARVNAKALEQLTKPEASAKAEPTSPSPGPSRPDKVEAKLPSKPDQATSKPSRPEQKSVKSEQPKPKPTKLKLED